MSGHSQRFTEFVQEAEKPFSHSQPATEEAETPFSYSQPVTEEAEKATPKPGVPNGSDLLTGQDNCFFEDHYRANIPSDVEASSLSSAEGALYSDDQITRMVSEAVSAELDKRCSNQIARQGSVDRPSTYMDLSIETAVSAALDDVEARGAYENDSPITSTESAALPRGYYPLALPTYQMYDSNSIDLNNPTPRSRKYLEGIAISLSGQDLKGMDSQMEAISLRSSKIKKEKEQEMDYWQAEEDTLEYTAPAPRPPPRLQRHHSASSSVFAAQPPNRTKDATSTKSTATSLGALALKFVEIFGAVGTTLYLSGQLDPDDYEVSGLLLFKLPPFIRPSFF
jgi:hypothetical protein